VVTKEDADHGAWGIGESEREEGTGTYEKLRNIWVRVTGEPNRTGLSPDLTCEFIGFDNFFRSEVLFK
jgi:hypothetical protein